MQLLNVKLLLVLFALQMTSVSPTYSQINREDSIILYKAIREVKPEGQIVYVDSVSLSSDIVDQLTESLKSKNLMDVHGKQVKRGTKDEREYLLAQLAMPVAWPDSLFPGSMRIEGDSIWAYLKQMNASRFETVNKAMAQNDTLKIKELQQDYPYVFVFTKPAYIRNNTVSLIYIFAFCGHTCGQTEASLYRKENDVWSKWIILSAGDF